MVTAARDLVGHRVTPVQKPLQRLHRVRGYRWNDGSDSRPRSWYIDIDEASQASEIDFLRKTIYLRDVELRVQRMSA